MTEPRRFHRPALIEPRQADELPGGLDPAAQAEVAHETAGALVACARQAAPDDPALVERLLALVETEGIDIIAHLWAASPADSLPGVLWRLYLLRQWIRQDPRLPDRYRFGAARAEVEDVIVGVAHPPGLAELRDLADSILSGAFTGEFDIALNRAAAFCRVVAIGTAVDADLLDQVDVAGRDTRQAGNLMTTAQALDRAAELWRAGRLD